MLLRHMYRLKLNNKKKFHENIGSFKKIKHIFPYHSAIPPLDIFPREIKYVLLPISITHAWMFITALIINQKVETIQMFMN